MHDLAARLLRIALQIVLDKKKPRLSNTISFQADRVAGNRSRRVEMFYKYVWEQLESIHGGRQQESNLPKSV